jgi:hypothetical protein
MNKDGELWLPPLSLVAIAVLTVLISFVFPIIPFRITGQAALIAVLVRAFIGWPAMRGWVASMPAPHRAVFLLLILGMIAGHFTLQTHRFFPFVAWEIFPFAREEDPVTCREFIAMTASGKTTRLLVEQLFPSIVQFNPPDDNDSPAMGKLVDAMAKVYDRHHRDDPVQRVYLVRVAVALHPAAAETTLASETLKTFPVSSP